MSTYDEREREDLAVHVEKLETQLSELERALGHAETNTVADVLAAALQAVTDELHPMRLRLDELDEDAGWDGWREDRRNAPIVL